MGVNDGPIYSTNEIALVDATCSYLFLIISCWRKKEPFSKKLKYSLKIILFLCKNIFLSRYSKYSKVFLFSQCRRALGTKRDLYTKYNSLHSLVILPRRISVAVWCSSLTIINLNPLKKIWWFCVKITYGFIQWLLQQLQHVKESLVRISVSTRPSHGWKVGSIPTRGRITSMHSWIFF